LDDLNERRMMLEVELSIIDTSDRKVAYTCRILNVLVYLRYCIVLKQASGIV